MDSIKWKCKNWIVHFEKFDKFHLIHLIVEKLDVLNFHPIFSITITTFTPTYEIRTRFLKKIHQKWKYYREEKHDFERFLIFFNIRMSARSKKLELCEEKSRASGMSCLLCIETKMKKAKV